MGVIKKILVGTGIAAAVTGIVVYVRRLTKAGDELEVVPSAMIHKVDFTGVTIRLDLRLKNPTSTGLKIKFPFIKLIYKDASIGTSQAIDKRITIPKNGEAVIEGIMINIPLLGLFSLGADFYKAVKSGAGILVKVRTLSSIDLGIRKVPFETQKEITLKKSTQIDH